MKITGLVQHKKEIERLELKNLRLYIKLNSNSINTDNTSKEKKTNSASIETLEFSKYVMSDGFSPQSFCFDGNCEETSFSKIKNVKGTITNPFFGKNPS